MTSDTDRPDTPDPPDPPRKATNAVVAGRVEEVLRLRIDGATFADIRDYANHPDRNWQLSDSQLKRYIQRSDELLRERTERSRGKATRLHLARREGLYARALSAADFRTALAVLDSAAKLRGLFDDPKALRDEAVAMLAKIAQLEDAARAGNSTPDPTDRPGAAPAGAETPPGAAGVEPDVPPS